MNEFLFNYLFAKYKDTTIQNAKDLKKKVYNDYKIIINSDLYIAINKYQVSKYGCALRVDSRLYNNRFYENSNKRLKYTQDKTRKQYEEYLFNKRNGLLWEQKNLKNWLKLKIMIKL